MLTQGIPTGGKHCVPLANIFLTYIIRILLEKDSVFKSLYDRNLKLWQRFIDDCLGNLMGKQKLFMIVGIGYFETFYSISIFLNLNRISKNMTWT